MTRREDDRFVQSMMHECDGQAMSLIPRPHGPTDRGEGCCHRRSGAGHHHRVRDWLTHFHGKQRKQLKKDCENRKLRSENHQGKPNACTLKLMDDVALVSCLCVHMCIGRGGGEARSLGRVERDPHVPRPQNDRL
jgi:hypothetical protein